MGLDQRTVAVESLTHKHMIHSIPDRWVPLAIAMGAAVLFLLSRSEPIAVVGNQITPEVEPGGSITVTREVDWYRPDCTEAAVSAVITDSMQFNHLLDAKVIPIRREMDTSRTFMVPFAIPWGRTIYQSDLTFSCAPFFKAWPIKVRLPELEFQVLPPLP